ncbi:IS66 family transposase, partial [bacterium]|nr:IS66 family transposase [bacterium]
MRLINLAKEIPALSATSQQALVKHPDLRKLDSHNSSKPPSSDKGKKKKLVNLRKDTDRKPGGQEGHPGSTLQSVSNPNHIKKHPAAACPCCGKELSSTPVVEVEKRQVFDIPPL